jgi:uncharacterized membrane protein
MNKKYWVLLGIATFVYIVYHLATLIYSPLPWFDEVSFLSMTESYMKDGTLFEQARIIGEPAEKLNYGPIYFVWQALMIKTFGYGIFTVRITNMLMGFFCLFLVYRIGFQLKMKQQIAIAAVVIMALEPNFNQFLHSGRMDFIGLAFFLLSYITFHRSDNKNQTTAFIFAALTGILLCCSILTNPRFVFTFPVYMVYFLYEIIADPGKNRIAVFVKYVSIAVAFAAVYYLWIFVTFGGVTEYIYFTTHATYLKDHLGMGTKFRVRYNLFIFIFAFLLFLLLAVKGKLKEHPHLALFTVPAIASFIAIVHGGIEGRYFALSIPFVALLLAGIALQLLQIKPLKYVTYVMCAGFIAVFLFKGLYIITTIPQHDPYRNEQLITKYIEPNTSVFGDFEFYYIARNKSCSFLTTQMNGSVPELTKYILEHKIKYVILNKTSDVKQYYEPAFLNDHYEFVTFVENKSYSGFFARILNKLPYKISDSYSCYIYRYKG